MNSAMPTQWQVGRAAVACTCAARSLEQAMQRSPVSLSRLLPPAPPPSCALSLSLNSAITSAVSDGELAVSVWPARPPVSLPRLHTLLLPSPPLALPAPTTPNTPSLLSSSFVAAMIELGASADDIKACRTNNRATQKVCVFSACVCVCVCACVLGTLNPRVSELCLHTHADRQRMCTGARGMAQEARAMRPQREREDGKEGGLEGQRKRGPSVVPIFAGGHKKNLAGGHTKNLVGIGVPTRLIN